MNKETEYIAVDFVFVPGGETYAKAVEWNRKFCDSRIRLGFRMAPHLSLLMCYVKRFSIQTVLEKLSILQHEENIHEYFNLTTGKLSLVDVGLDKPILSWEIQDSPSLRNLQIRLIHTFEEFRENPSPDTKKKAFWGNVDESTVKWTDRYWEHSTGSGFDPHITIGFWDSCDEVPDLTTDKFHLPFHDTILGIQSPDSTLSERDREPLSLFQLGNHCTCRLRLKATFSKELEKSYRATDYRVNEFPDESIRIGNRHGFLDRLLVEKGLKTWAYITAWNPYSRDLSEISPGEERYPDKNPAITPNAEPERTYTKNQNRNRRRNQSLEEMIREEGWFYLRGRGEGRDENGNLWSEESFLILGIEKEEAQQLSAFWEQNAFVWGECGGVAELQH